MRNFAFKNMTNVMPCVYERQYHIYDLMLSLSKRCSVMAGEINYGEIAEVLGAMKCPVHNTSAQIDFGATSLGYRDVCCDEFENKLDDEFARQLELHLFGDA